MTLEKSGLREKYHLNVIAVQRKRSTLPIEAKTILKGGDILLFMARPEDSVPAFLAKMLLVLPSGGWQEEYLSTPNLRLIEAAIAPRSHLASQTLSEIRFEQKFNAKVLAVWRHGRSIRTRLADLPLEFGDGLLLQGNEKSLSLLRTEPGLILLAESAPVTRMTWRGWLTVLIMFATLSLAVVFPNDIAEIMLTGAMMMVLIGAMSMDQAYPAIDWRSLFLVAGILPLGVALNKTGASIMFADAILSNLSGAGHLALLAGFVLLTVALTQVINATTTTGHTSTYTQDFNSGGPGQVTLNGGVVTYTPPINGCGVDEFYYIVSDGQVGGTSLGKVTVTITESTPVPPVITGCPADLTIGLDASCGAVPRPDRQRGVSIQILWRSK